MNLALVDVVTVTAAVLGAAVVFTVWKFTSGAAHDRATTKLLTRFFDGKVCAICKRPIPPVHRSGMKPGLWNPKTHQTHSWKEIPDANLAAMLENELPVCSDCEVAESFRQHYPDRFTDGEQSRRDAHAG